MERQKPEVDIGNLKPCNFCENDPLINYKTSYKTLERKYFEAFNFYFAKPVNEILANVSSPHVILFKDYLFYDDESNEYLKRYYKSEEIRPRVKALTDFYLGSYKPTRPNLCVIEASKIINKRNQKLNKLFFAKSTKEGMKENREVNENQVENVLKMEDENMENENLLLENILTSNFEKEDNESQSQLHMGYKYQEEIKEHQNDILPYLEQKDEKEERISYETSDHDIYNPEFSQEQPLLKEFDQLLKPSKSNENKPLSLNKIKTRSTFKQKESATNNNNNANANIGINCGNLALNNNKQNYELLLEEIISKQKQTADKIEKINNSPSKINTNPKENFATSFKINNNIIKDFSENRISDISELLTLHEMIRNSQKISVQSSSQKEKECIKEKDAPRIKKKEVSSQLTQDSTKRTTGNTTTASQNAKNQKNQEKLNNKKIHISHNTLFSQINRFHNKTGNVDHIFELIKKMQKEEEKTSLLPLEESKPAKSSVLRNCSTKSNKDLISSNGPRFLGSQTDRVPDKSHEKIFLKPKHPVKKLNLNLLHEKKPKEKKNKPRSPSTSRHSNKRNIEVSNNNNNNNNSVNNNNNSMKGLGLGRKNAEQRGKPTKISFRSLNSNIYSSLRNRSNISSKSHIDTQRSSDVLVFKSQEQLIPKNMAANCAQHKSQLENLEENESSYGFWTSRSNKVNLEDLKKRNKSPDLLKKLDSGKNYKMQRDDYYNYGLIDVGKIKAKTDRFEKDNEINQFIKMAYENPQIFKMKGETGKNKKKPQTGGVKRTFKLNLPINGKI